MSRLLSIGVVGAGTIAERGHVPAYLASGRARIAAVVDADRGRAEGLARGLTDPAGHPARAYTDLSEMLARERLDGVSICTPNTLHVPMALETLSHGIPTLLEKPMALDPEGAQALVEAQARAQTPLLVGMTHRFRPEVVALSRFLEAGELGRIYHVNARLLQQRSVPRGWFGDRALAGGGVLWDLGVHVLDLAWWLIGRPVPERVSAHLETALSREDVDFIRPWSGKMPPTDPALSVEDFAAAWVRFAGGATLSLQVAWAANLPPDGAIRLEVLGTRAGATLPPAELHSSRHRVLTRTALRVAEEDPFSREIAHFLDVAEGKAEPLCPAAEGAQVVRLLHGVREASRRGREWTWEGTADDGPTGP